jgi:hypothetical protein
MKFPDRNASNGFDPFASGVGGFTTGRTALRSRVSHIDIVVSRGCTTEAAVRL